MYLLSVDNLHNLALTRAVLVCFAKRFGFQVAGTGKSGCSLPQDHERILPHWIIPEFIAHPPIAKTTASIIIFKIILKYFQSAVPLTFLPHLNFLQFLPNGFDTGMPVALSSVEAAGTSDQTQHIVQARRGRLFRFGKEIKTADFIETEEQSRGQTWTGSLQSHQMCDGPRHHHEQRQRPFQPERELKQQLELFVKRYNADASPFQWAATADSILQKIERAAKRYSATGHWSECFINCHRSRNAGAMLVDAGF